MGIPNAALPEYAGLAGNTGSKTAFSYMELDASATAFAASQTALVSAITTGGCARAAGTPSLITTTQANDTLQLTKTWSVSGTLAINAVGIFNNASGGTMGNRKVLPATRNVVSGDTYTATVKIACA